MRGELAKVEADYVVIDVHGVGYKVNLPLVVLAQMPPVGEQVALPISTMVKEDSITLYGFADDSQQGLFELLLTVSGVGPKVGLNILSAMTVEQIVNAISSERFQELNRVQGVGTKTAQRIVLELGGKITSFVWAQAARKETPTERRVVDDAIEGLVALGYNRDDARRAAEEARKAVDEDDTGGIVRYALNLLS